MEIPINTEAFRRNFRLIKLARIIAARVNTDKKTLRWFPEVKPVSSTAKEANSKPISEIAGPITIWEKENGAGALFD